MSEARKEYVCAECGCVIEDENKMVTVDGATYCEDCRESVLIECERCGELHRLDELYSVTSDGVLQQWCEDCYENHAFVCDHCEEAFDEDYYSSAEVYAYGNSETWCRDCVDEYAVTCRDCGDIVSRENAHYVEGVDEYVCGICVTDGYYTCDRCGGLFMEDDMYSSSDNYYHVCRGCAEDSYDWYWCDGCSTFIHEDDWDCEMGMCYECRDCRRRSDNARVRAYGSDPALVFFNGGKREYCPSHFCGCGIELEVDRDDSNGKCAQECLNKLDELFGAHAYYKHDGSLNHGFEIVTMPHTIKEFYELPWDEALTACIDNGYKSHEAGTCGLHMHVSRTMFGDDEEEQSDNIAKLMQFYEMYWIDILKVSRRTEEQARQWARRYMRVRKETLKNFAKHKEHCDRYMAVNVTNRSTVEIRINRGTLKTKTFLATCDFILTTCQNASKIDWADVSDDYLWLKGLKKETLVYLADRSAFGEPVWKYLQDIQKAEHDALMAELEERRREAEAESEPNELPFDIGIERGTFFPLENEGFDTDDQFCDDNYAVIFDVLREATVQEFHF